MKTNPIEIEKNIYISQQISVQDFPSLADIGIKTVINNRPDGESEDQPSSEELENAAHNAGINYRHIPVIPGKLNSNHLEQFEEVLQSTSSPVLAFCKSGLRAANLWAMHKSKHEKSGTIIDQAMKAGFDVEPLLKKIARTETA